MRVYTDGSCSRSDGGWGWWNETLNESDSGFSHGTTNQRMELQAALEAIDTYLDDPHLVIISDSAYLVNCFRDGWWEKWERNNWVGVGGKPVANRDIWQKLIALVKANGNVRFEWTKAHAGDIGNEKADQLANEARLGEESSYG